MIRENHAAIVVSGLGDQVTRLEWATGKWPRQGIIPVIHPVYWRDGEDFKFQLERLAERTRLLTENYELVSLVGTSAGGSIAVLTSLEEEVYKVVTVCSGSVCWRLSAGLFCSS